MYILNDAVLELIFTLEKCDSQEPLLGSSNQHIKKDAIKLVEQNGIEDALELLNRCIEMGTTYGSAYNNMVKLYRMLHENIEAIHDVNKVVSLEEEQSKAYIQRAILKCQDGDILGSKVNFAIGPKYGNALLKASLFKITHMSRCATKLHSKQ
ncbi:hypothetical protein PHYBLDRAFT_68519 [Phycomyces blakesleeanus NRRL 1555(-)]|uniref:Uncharacterized protein n=1 Tax=Phycomyces blakesleeanus (strain ATCC 8743b / DSM 1359 / FGSC 10004 / NBRC 33097 / NRRL 1555) TaxID=763407 RepID=A0A163B2X5_PHYB8|nr:hypothetical protein PHYBLDRAFT_68519 [Phycomyces blakesleeanus NRRL 1555(-)]OAD77981.1 hypothetical protein PHYBLDRAFT_68519 [Phycomyces blakesleeanus NRRL 1555(-)]|eukprot:XP_018296021.1 hypothetical protein PHYBLDRAFT_68519 [Phycomyces blakesleeanus NRRL 1555(-)]